MNADALALYAGYAFAQAVQVQSVLEEGALMVPFVVHWRNESPTAIPYPAKTQEQAVALAIQAREDRTKSPNGWSSGREGLLTQTDGTKRDVLTIEAWVPGLCEHLLLLHYYVPRPFTLVGGFMYKNNPEFKRTAEENKLFSHHFRRGISSHPFGEACFRITEKAVDQWPQPQRQVGTAYQTLTGDGWRIKIPAEWGRPDENTDAFFNAKGSQGLRILTIIYDDSRGPEEILENTHKTFVAPFESNAEINFRVLRHQKASLGDIHFWIIDLYDERRRDRVIYKHMTRPPFVLSILCHDFDCTQLPLSNEVFDPILASAELF